MGTVLHPKGSQPPGVYWRRRALVLALVVVLVIVVAWVAWPKGKGAATATQTGGVSTPVATAATTPTASPSASGSSTPSGPVTCDPGSVGLDLAGYQKVKQGSKQVFRVSVKNTADPCVLRVAADNFDLTVKSGTDRIWSTADCAKWVPTAANVTLKQGQAHQLDLTWGLVRSKANCAKAKGALKPGTYVATVTFAKRVNAIQVFTISKAG